MVKFHINGFISNTQFTFGLDKITDFGIKLGWFGKPPSAGASGGTQKCPLTPPGDGRVAFTEATAAQLPRGRRSRRGVDLKAWSCWGVDQDQFAHVELVGEPLPFAFVKDVFVVVISAGKTVTTRALNKGLCSHHHPAGCRCACTRVCMCVC